MTVVEQAATARRQGRALGERGLRVRHRPVAADDAVGLRGAVRRHGLAAGRQRRRARARRAGHALPLRRRQHGRAQRRPAGRARRARGVVAGRRQRLGRLPRHVRGDVARVGTVSVRAAAVAAADARRRATRRPTRATSCACDRGTRLRTLARAHARDPRLRMVIERFATYAGADPRRAPAALAVAGYVEHAFGAWHVRGGIHRLVTALERRLRALGGALRFDTRVDALLLSGRRVRGVSTAAGPIDADAVVWSGDALALDRLLGRPTQPEPERSLSGLRADARPARAQRRASCTTRSSSRPTTTPSSTTSSPSAGSCVIRRCTSARRARATVAGAGRRRELVRARQRAGGRGALGRRARRLRGRARRAARRRRARARARAAHARRPRARDGGACAARSTARRRTGGSARCAGRDRSCAASTGCTAPAARRIPAAACRSSRSAGASSPTSSDRRREPHALAAARVRAAARCSCSACCCPPASGSGGGGSPPRRRPSPRSCPMAERVDVGRGVTGAAIFRPREATARAGRRVPARLGGRRPRVLRDVDRPPRAARHDRDLPDLPGAAVPRPADAAAERDRCAAPGIRGAGWRAEAARRRRALRGRRARRRLRGIRPRRRDAGAGGGLQRLSRPLDRRDPVQLQPVDASGIAADTRCSCWPVRETSSSGRASHARSRAPRRSANDAADRARPRGRRSRRARAQLAGGTAGVLETAGPARRRYEVGVARRASGSAPFHVPFEPYGRKRANSSSEYHCSSRVRRTTSAWAGER